jgi:hypothetical protein
MSTLATSSKPTLCIASSSLQHKTLACSINANASADADHNADADSEEIYHATAHYVERSEIRVHRDRNQHATTKHDPRGYL